MRRRERLACSSFLVALLVVGCGDDSRYPTIGGPPGSTGRGGAGGAGAGGADPFAGCTTTGAVTCVVTDEPTCPPAGTVLATLTTGGGCVQDLVSVGGAPVDGACCGRSCSRADAGCL